MSDADEECRAIWRSLTNNQRAHLAAKWSKGPGGRWFGSMSIVANRVLGRRGLLDPRGPGARAAEWAIREGYAQWDAEVNPDAYLPERRGEWRVVPAGPSRPSGKIDSDRLVALIAQGMHGAAIAEELGVSREGVRVAAKRLGLTLQGRPKKVKPSKPPRVLRPQRLVFHVSDDERAAIEKAAAEAGASVAEYVRGRALS